MNGSKGSGIYQAQLLLMTCEMLPLLKSPLKHEPTGVLTVQHYLSHFIIILSKEKYRKLWHMCKAPINAGNHTPPFCM